MMSDWLKDQLVEGYGQGRSTRSLAMQFGRSPTTIRRWLKMAGVTLRPRGRPRHKGEE